MARKKRTMIYKILYTENYRLSNMNPTKQQRVNSGALYHTG